MHHQLVAHIRKFVPISEEEAAVLESYTHYQQIKKKAGLLKEGQVCTTHYFVLRGVLRLYALTDRGTEQIIQFAIDNWWLSDYTSFDRQTPSGFYIQAVEDTTLLCIERSAQDHLFAKVPQLESYFRVVFQRAYAASLMRIQYIFCLTKEERYHHFNNAYPEFVQRIPQYMLASFLGFTPEFLSKTRAKRG